ncbi:MNN22 [Symbiodinium natans]|uniref:MNN22 protein n=1 Tax=Symbiodinium natans TaxID=878477 RepID=A0A812VAC0_9DINO|nr:MNN22 [Symbiodinium natans]
MPTPECLEYLPSERRAFELFMQDLRATPLPKPGSFEGRGIVMSGGPMHVLQAIANLEVLRVQMKSNLPVEFWHAFELEEAHCDALATWGAACRKLQVPGVYRDFQTILPSIMSSSFKEILWVDTDITLLYRPELLFDSPQFLRQGALFWPDHWSFDCRPWGHSARSNHVILKLLNLEHNASNMHYAHEHETSHFFINKEMHWKPICLANFLATRTFSNEILHGAKDVFRFAFLKLNASIWLSPVRPGLIGAFMLNGLFLPRAMLHFWPAGGFLGSGSHGRNVLLCIHQKKQPGSLWSEIITFEVPIGTCSSYFPVAFDPFEATDVNIWQIGQTDPQLAENISLAEQLWDEAYYKARNNLLPLLSKEAQQKLHPQRSKTAQTLSHLVWCSGAARSGGLTSSLYSPSRRL